MSVPIKSPDDFTPAALEAIIFLEPGLPKEKAEQYLTLLLGVAFWAGKVAGIEEAAAAARTVIS